MRPNARARGYTTEWDKRSREFRKRNPLCKICYRIGIYRQAECVDHITPHKGDQKLFWDEGNWQSLCADCHNRKKQQEEKHGYHSDVDANGYPTDPNHPANK